MDTREYPLNGFFINDESSIYTLPRLNQNHQLEARWLRKVSGMVVELDKTNLSIENWVPGLSLNSTSP